MSYLIKDTTREERKNIVKNALGISIGANSTPSKETVELAKEAGVVVTEAGATFPYHKDPGDTNIRIAPSFPKIDELEKGMEVLCACAKLAAVQKLIEEKK